MKRFFTFIKNNYLFVLFLLIYAGIIIAKLIARPAPFYDWDESLYVQTGKEMLEKKFFLFPIWQGEIWFDKPPLVPLVYGLVIKILFFLPPELATHLFTLAIALVVLIFLYLLYKKVAEDQFVPTIAVLLTSLTPIFLQRAQVVNLDVFLLLGWLGYLLFYPRFLLSLFFLFIAVFSKSLIGFYAPALMFAYFIGLWILKKEKWPTVKKNLIRIVVQSLILLAWFGAMLVMYGKTFWQLHIIESHFRRVTASIESHFGKRTYYIDLAIEQFGIYFFLSLIGLLTTIYLYLKKKIDEKQLLIALYLLPWFLFLNATKTKIFWYLFAAIPQFGFLVAVPLLLFRKQKKILIILAVILTLSIIHFRIYEEKVFEKEYSSYDSRYRLSLFAKKNCSELIELVNPETRNTFVTLQSLGLLISTSKWWGSRPSTVYYFGKHVTFVYDKEEMMKKIKNLSKGSCIVLDQKDNTQYKVGLWNRIDAFESSYLYKQNSN